MSHILKPYESVLDEEFYPELATNGMRVWSAGSSEMVLAEFGHRLPN